MARNVRKRTEAGAIYCSDPLELNRWCIEMAMRWPVATPSYSYSGTYQQMPPMPKAEVIDLNIIERANKIMAWVKQKH